MEELNIFDYFPREIVVTICSFTKSSSIICLLLTCKNLQELVMDNMDYIVYNATDFRCFATSNLLKLCRVKSNKLLWSMKNWYDYGFGKNEYFCLAITCEKYQIKSIPEYSNNSEIIELGTALASYIEKKRIEKSITVINDRFAFTGKDIYDRKEDLFIDARTIIYPIKKYKNVVSVQKCGNMHVYLLDCDVPNISILYDEKELVLPRLFRLRKIYDFAIKKISTGFNIKVNIMASLYIAHYNSKGILTSLVLINKSS